MKCDEFNSRQKRVQGDRFSYRAFKQDRLIHIQSLQGRQRLIDVVYLHGIWDFTNERYICLSSKLLTNIDIVYRRQRLKLASCKCSENTYVRSYTFSTASYLVHSLCTSSYGRDEFMKIEKKKLRSCRAFAFFFTTFFLLLPFSVNSHSMSLSLL